MRSLSEHNRIRLVRVPAARGVVYDRNGELLIDNRASFDVVFVPEDARDRPAGAAHARRAISASPRTPSLERLRAPSKRPPYEGIVVRRDLDWQGVVALETHQLELPGVSLQVGPRRYYPYGPLAAHLLGYVGEVSETRAGEGDATDASGAATWSARRASRRPGTPSCAASRAASRSRSTRSAGACACSRRCPTSPATRSSLTLDRDLQEAAERALGDRDGAVVALDPRNGEVLVMVVAARRTTRTCSRAASSAASGARWCRTRCSR